MPCPWPAGSRASLVLHTSGPLVRPQSRHMQRITPVTSEDPDPQPRVNLDQSGPRTRAVSERGSAPPSPWRGVVWPTLWPARAQVLVLGSSFYFLLSRLPCLLGSNLQQRGWVKLMVIFVVSPSNELTSACEYASARNRDEMLRQLLTATCSTSSRAYGIAKEFAS